MTKSVNTPRIELDHEQVTDLDFYLTKVDNFGEELFNQRDAGNWTLVKKYLELMELSCKEALTIFVTPDKIKE